MLINRRVEIQVKKLSCGTLIVRENQGKKELFMAHVTNQSFWDIPKGGQNPNENYIKTAIRELYEESGIICSSHELLDLGMYDYTERKDLYLFKYIGNRNFCHTQAVCNSTFFSNLYQKHLPEVDAFKYVEFDDVLNHCSEGFKKVFPILIANNII